MKTLIESDIDQILLNFVEESSKQNLQEPVKQQVISESTEKYGFNNRDEYGNYSVNKDDYMNFLKDMIETKK